MSSQNDEATGVALGVTFSIVLLVISLVLGIAVHKSTAKVPPKAATATMTAGDDVPSLLVENGTVKFFFASGKFEVASGAKEALVEAVRAAQSGKILAISGFHDATGDAATNAELAKQRALAVRDVLKSLGVADEKIELRKPEVMLGAANNAQARRVDVVVN